MRQKKLQKSATRTIPERHQKGSGQTSAGDIKSIPVFPLFINNCRISRKVVELFCGLVSSPGSFAGS